MKNYNTEFRTTLLFIITIFIVLIEVHINTIKNITKEERDTQLYQIQIQSEVRDTLNMQYDAITGTTDLENNNN